VFAADLHDSLSCWDLIQYARSLDGEAYPILVNSAGTAEFGDFATVFAPHIEEQLRVNLLAPMLTTHAAIPWMLEHKGGQIINVLSIAAIETLPGSAIYTAAKAGLLAFGKVIAAEYRGQGVKVTSLIPGAIDTPLWDSQGSSPLRSEMLPKEALAEAIRDLIVLPHDRNVDEIHLLPPKGVL
jgi:3-oxoacyl-[acyl-carrier protein] reductase